VFWATHSCSIIFQSGIFKHRILILKARNDRKLHHTEYEDSFAESPTNPAVDIIDLELLGKIAKSTI
jgi:cystathionine beta-lyase/cystathionine gamma-synthase